MKNIAILGSTGSIGRMSLEVIRNHLTDFRVISLAAGQNITLLAEQAHEFRPEVVSIGREDLREDLVSLLRGTDIEVIPGSEGAVAVATMSSAHLLISAMAGAAGLLPTWRAVERGMIVALANKEAMVMGGGLLSALARDHGARIIPIDSEHSAIFQCLMGSRKQDVTSLILTASGGPFRQFTESQLSQVTPAQALAHPVWNMGRKVTIDSATLMNKGLEVIEARWLFDLPPEQIEVVVHPQSIIHSMVRYRDGSIISQLSRPDMRIPILYALTQPERWEAHLPELDLIATGNLTFHEPDLDRFPCLRLAFEALKSGGGDPIVLNRADEVAVEAFLGGLIPFTAIPGVIEAAIRLCDTAPVTTLEEISRVDQRAESVSRDIVTRIRRGEKP